ncbi:hypothetical protein BAU15_07425 [Enterococcus sp. JM4C]|uniref:DMT family transporter n=1 Tax=Candidatus Enterococcus huntleyi TaxID=1857217 RepID=UPI0013797D11|nr:DMT family transporter [Enterococcus sp. JM4C]KAF1297535.1 hypothetical protein BAU15_07425 [Enterococcus sp. JM4C]
MKKEGTGKGVILALVGATLWGINGAFADVVFSKFNAPVTWVVGTRLLVAGFLLLLYTKLVLKQPLTSIFRSKKDGITLLLFSLVGMIGCQYLFFLSIGKNGAGLATILQFTSPIFIYFYLIIKKEKLLHIKEIIYILLTFIGVFLLVTRGNFQQLLISYSGLLIGIGSAIGVAFYTLQPRALLKKYGSPLVVGWGMFLGGLAFQFVRPIWQPGFEITMQVVFYMAFIIIVGTAISFCCYLASVNYIDASLSNVIAAAEPLVANILAPILLGQTMTLIQMVGIAIVLVSVILFANHGERGRRRLEPSIGD